MSATSWHIAVYEGIRRVPASAPFCATVYVPHADVTKAKEGIKEALTVRFTGKTADEAEQRARKHVLDFQAQAKRMEARTTRGKPETFPYSEELRLAIVAWKDAFKESTEDA